MWIIEDSAQGPKYKGPSTRVQVQGPKCKGPSTRAQVQGPKYKGPSTRAQVQGPKCKGPSTRAQVQGPKCKGTSARAQVQGPKYKGPSTRAQVPDCSLSGRPAWASCILPTLCRYVPPTADVQTCDWHETCYKYVLINKLIILWYINFPLYFNHKGQSSTGLAILNFFLTSTLFQLLGTVETSRWHPQNTLHVVFVFQRKHFAVPVPEVRLPHFRCFFHHPVDGIPWQWFACKQYFCSVARTWHMAHGSRHIHTFHIILMLSSQRGQHYSCSEHQQLPVNTVESVNDVTVYCAVRQLLTHKQ